MTVLITGLGSGRFGEPPEPPVPPPPPFELVYIGGSKVLTHNIAECTVDSTGANLILMVGNCNDAIPAPIASDDQGNQVGVLDMVTADGRHPALQFYWFMNSSNQYEYPKAPGFPHRFTLVGEGPAFVLYLFKANYGIQATVWGVGYNNALPNAVEITAGAPMTIPTGKDALIFSGFGANIRDMTVGSPSQEWTTSIIPGVLMDSAGIASAYIFRHGPSSDQPRWTMDVANHMGTNLLAIVSKPIV